jgi:hypothetical protein
MQCYFLAPHVYSCVTEDHVVLLDLERDKYVGVAREQMSGLAERVKGWPLIGAASAGNHPAGTGPSDGSFGAQPPGTRAEAVFSRMLAAGMLTTDPAVGKEAKPVQLPEIPSVPLIQPDLDWRPAVRAVDVARFLLASAITALTMRLLPIRAVITGLAKRKRAAVGSSVTADTAVARRATEAFIRLRPLLFGAQDACLYDSLALTRFLSYYGQYPTCVIGVQTSPFAAHCWVQEGAFVFNDDPENVRRFTPILAV